MQVCRLRRALCALALAAVGVLGIAVDGASAHADLVASVPASGTRLDRQPVVVSLRFDEQVSFDIGSVAVVDTSGRRVDAGPPAHPAGDLDAVQVSLRPGLAPGSYGVLWHVVSADGHPVSGSFSFGIDAAPQRAPAQPAPAPATTALHAVGSVAAYLGVVLLVGVPFFLVTIWPAGLHEPRLRRLLRAGWWLCAAGALVLFAVQGPYGAGLGPQALLDPGLLAQTLTGRVGLLMLGRLFVLGLAAASGPWPGTASVAALRRDGIGLGVLVLVTFAPAGHPGEGALAPLAATVDAVHLAAASVWLGGLVVLLGAVLRKPAISRPGEPAVGELLARWSRLAMAAVGVVAVTGAFQAWREVGTLDSLQRSDYGHVLLAKLAAVAGLLVVADLSRRAVRRLGGRGGVEPGHGAQLRRLRGRVLAEVAVGAVILVLTSVLVGTPPPRADVPPAAPGLIPSASR